MLETQIANYNSNDMKKFIYTLFLLLGANLSVFGQHTVNITSGEVGNSCVNTTRGFSVTYAYSGGGSALAPSCQVYYWTVTNGTITAGQNTDEILVSWDATGGGNVNVILESELGGGSCPPGVYITDDYPVTVVSPTAGDMTITTTPTGILCSGDQKTLTATVSGAAVWDGWYNSSNVKVSSGAALSVVVSSADSYQARASLTSCGTNTTITRTAFVSGPIVYDQGTPIGNRTVYNGKPVTGSVRVVGSNAQIDYWEQKVGSGSWTTYQTASSSSDLSLSYEETFTDQTLFRAHILKQCMSEADSYLPTITIDVIEYVPDYNRITTVGKDETGADISKSAQYFDDGGKLLQSQSWDKANQEVFVSEPMYDKYRRTVGQTLPAPAGRNYLEYKNNFVTNGGDDYTYNNFDKSVPDPVDDSTPGTLGHYYGANSNAVAETKYPYAVSDFYEDGTGESKSASQPGDFHHLESGNVGKQKQFPVLDGELRYYEDIRNLIIGQNNSPSKIMKQIGVDGIGNEGVSYVDQGGNTLASAIGGGTPYTTPITKDNDGVTEIHIPKGVTASFVGYTNITDLTTELSVTSTSLSQGFYSVEKATGIISYYPTYSDFTYNFYDNMGRIVASMTPRGTEEIIANGGVAGYTKTTLPFTTLYTYDFQGRLLSMSEPDAGETRYIYREDGQIRFSQNATQEADAAYSRFSVTSYDELGRPIESMEYKVDFNAAHVRDFNNYFTNTNGHVLVINESGPFYTASASERVDWIKTYYDKVVAQPGVPAAISTRIGSQDFLSGAVSSTESEEVQSWYSYDEQGRVTWFLQHFKRLSDELNATNGTNEELHFLIEYTYDFLGNVTMVAFQPQTEDNDVSEALYHHYEYDGNQRLTKVETSIKELGDRFLHAEYSYYLHGPLERVVLADGMQGIDYTYTAQGWLKGINHPIKGLDPGEDGVLDTDGDGKPDVSEDAFGMTLEYFENDYKNTGTTGFNSLALDNNAFPEQPQGNIRAVVFPGAENGEYQVNGQPDDVETDQYDPKQVNLLGKESVTLQPGFNTGGGRLSVGVGSYDLNTANNVEAYAYSYDHKYQLTDAKFGKSSDMVNADNAYDVTIGGQDANGVPLDSYDANGNIQGIERYADDPSSLENNFDFDYKPGTNQLVSVSGYITLLEYNDLGQLVKQVFEDGSERHITYNVSGKVTAVYSDADMENPDNLLIAFAYDDRGFRAMKQVGDVENWYVRDASGQVMAIYNRKAGDIAQAELPIYGASKLGMAFKNPDHYKYIYELTDHLGNVRALVTKLALQATASMEATEDARESQFFDNLDSPVRQQVGARSKSGTHFALTNPNQPVGPTTTLRVKAGDVINLEVFAKYVVPGGFNNGMVTGGVGSLLGGGVNDAAVGVEGGGLSAAVTGELTSLMGAATANSGQPKAYLQFILFDDNFTKVDSDQVMTDSNFDPEHGGFEHLALTTNATVDGYLYAYIVNESTLDIDFDDFTFIQSGTRVIRQTDYYPFGAVAKVWNNPEQTQRETYRHGYQGEYSEMDTTTGWNSFELRMYDPLIGRWLQVDPARQFSSPYNGMGNNPVSGVDPDGAYFFGLFGSSSSQRAEARSLRENGFDVSCITCKEIRVGFTGEWQDTGFGYSSRTHWTFGLQRDGSYVDKGSTSSISLARGGMTSLFDDLGPQILLANPVAKGIGLAGKGIVTIAGRYATSQAAKSFTSFMTTNELRAYTYSSRVGVQALMRGKGVDAAFRYYAGRNLILSTAQRMRLITIGPRNFGPDVIGRGLFKNTWWDVTTKGAWNSHVVKYHYRYGNGIELLYK